jgi:ubiquinone/menaquinone biosynthesis C-methylase UbiE
MHIRQQNFMATRSAVPPSHSVCPIERAEMLETRLRKLLYPPGKIIQTYIRPGMTVLDFGCGPGVFTVDMAVRVGASGRVIAADVQEGMLRRVKAKVHGLLLEKRVVLRQCQPDQIGISEQVDFALAFWVVHEVPDQKMFFHELYAILKPGARVLIVEPPFHVSRAAFEAMMREAAGAGLVSVESPNIHLCQSTVLMKR